MVLVAVLALLDMAASAANRLVFPEDFPAIYPAIYPGTSPFVSMEVGLGKIGPQNLPRAIDRLMGAADSLSRRANVPYVFGGRSVAAGNRRSDQSCQECSACIHKNNLPANSTMSRYNNCAACRRCGIDCSGFANSVFNEAGMKYGFADTKSLNVAGDGFLQRQYGFNNIGQDLAMVRRGDLILEKGHILLVLEVNLPLGTIDYIHASRASKRNKLGGIEIRRHVPIDPFQHSVKRILRHVELMTPEESGDNLGYVDFLWFNLKQSLNAGHWI
jgi:NlpC/P60 family